MARALRIQYPGAFYHVTCRGNQRRNIFLDDDDRYHFLKMLAESLDIYGVVLYAYVLMPNHFHLVIETVRANLSEFMRRFNVCYTGWFNYHHGSYGHLFQGRYKAFLVDADQYFLEISRYVHLNPVRSRKTRQSTYQSKWTFLNKYRWSSMPGYTNARRRNDFVNYTMILDMVGGRNAYKNFLLDGLKIDLKNPFDDVQYQVILGDNDFVARVRNEYMQEGSVREQPQYREMMTTAVTPDTIIETVMRVLKVSREEILGKHGSGITRGMVGDLLYKYGNMNHREIGVLLGIDYSSVSKLRRRLMQRMIEKNDIAEQYKRIVTRLTR
jgi:putative transposase